jgi:hypothetical protein
MTKKPTTVKEWEKVCENLNKALNSMMADEAILKARITGMEDKVMKYVGIVQYLEMTLDRLNSVRGN